MFIVMVAYFLLATVLYLILASMHICVLVRIDLVPLCHLVVSQWGRVYGV